ncbi:hypothetical protein J22TS1_17210 [Siminovitchia terrae]|uniref:TDP-N-acetylfucosamine:lipid II N-acetylfucosaminyltransferase n=1 Tax=Siminovitchia terrae TaxID=1914933 RepID=UPI001B007B95|nr:TDP-N-acetylfucosamine:lipid II N-acetylfucosaminyltransferase [Siminovitchia terrae]GIN90670.1 hypothetical protein J22TS1_17210 [Siminovitchia terrae]
MVNLHVIKDEKFTSPFINFVNNNFGNADHRFIIIDNKKSSRPLNVPKNVEYINTGIMGLLKLSKYLYASQKIFLHGLFNTKIVLFLFLQSWLLKKCYWIIWGGDLYSLKEPKHSQKDKAINYIRKKTIKRMAGFITHIKGDYELAKKWCGAKGKYYYSFMYPSNLYKKYELKSEDKDRTTTYIQVGNSADPSNNHIDILITLKKYKNERIQIICPLSYGNENYKDKVIKIGKEIFGDKFQPLVNFMPLDEYLAILAKIDIAIFNHKRQQAMGNIITLLGLGKKVYIRDDITTWEFCKEHNLVVYRTNDPNGITIDKINEQLAQENAMLTRTQFSLKKLRNDWERIFTIR